MPIGVGLLENAGVGLPENAGVGLPKDGFEVAGASTALPTAGVTFPVEIETEFEAGAETAGAAVAGAVTAGLRVAGVALVDTVRLD